MELDAKKLKPGMVLMEDVLGKNGKPIVPKDRVLSEVEIEFIQKFLIENVRVKRTVEDKIITNGTSAREKRQKEEEPKRLVKNEFDVIELDPFIKVFKEVVGQYKSLYTSWQANLPVNMYHVRQLCMPLFEMVEEQSIDNIRSLVSGREKDLFYYKCVVVSLLSIKLAQLLNYKRKNWLQIGFAAILIDIGLTKSKPAIDSHQSDPRHPILSFEMIKDEPTLTKQAKLAIIQHHERLDGSGFPLKLKADKIHPYSRIIAVADRYITLYIDHREEAKEMLLNENRRFDEQIVRLL